MESAGNPNKSSTSPFPCQRKRAKADTKYLIDQQRKEV
jgi:hypothetical protein